MKGVSLAGWARDPGSGRALHMEEECGCGMLLLFLQQGSGYRRPPHDRQRGHTGLISVCPPWTRLRLELLSE